MPVLNVVVNAGIVLVELATVAAIGWLAWTMPQAFAGLTGLLALIVGVRLERERLAFETPFYFERTGTLGRAMRLLIGGIEATWKAMLASAIALITFSGTDINRLAIVAGVFAALVLVGSMTLRRGAISLGVRAARWGYFRMAAPFGLVFSAALGLFPPPTLAGLAWRAVFDLPSRPSVAQLGEALFQIRLWIDDLVVKVLTQLMGADLGRIVGILVSSNVLAGFVLALYAVAVSEIVRGLEERHWQWQERRSPRA